MYTSRRTLGRSFISRFRLRNRGERLGFARLPAINAGLGLERAKRPVRDRREKLTVAPFRGTFLLHLSVPNFYMGKKPRTNLVLLFRCHSSLSESPSDEQIVVRFVRSIVEEGQVLFDTDFERFSRVQWKSEIFSAV